MSYSSSPTMELATLKKWLVDVQKREVPGTWDCIIQVPKMQLFQMRMNRRTEMLFWERHSWYPRYIFFTICASWFPFRHLAEYSYTFALWKDGLGFEMILISQLQSLWRWKRFCFKVSTSVDSLIIITTQRLLINIGVIRPKGLKIRSFVWLKRTKERVAKNCSLNAEKISLRSRTPMFRPPIKGALAENGKTPGLNDPEVNSC